MPSSTKRNTTFSTHFSRQFPATTRLTSGRCIFSIPITRIILFSSLATVESEEKRIIRVIGIEKIQRPEVKRVVAGNCREKCVEKVVFLFVELGIVNTKNLIKFGACTIHLHRVQVIDNDGEGKLAEIVALKLDLLDAFPEFSNLRLLRIIR